MITIQEKATLQACAALLPVVIGILIRESEEVNKVTPTEISGSSRLLTTPPGRRAKVIYNGVPLNQNEAVHNLLKELALKKSAAEIRTMFGAQEIFGSNRPQRQVVVTPEEHAKFTADYKLRYNTKEPIITLDKVKLYVWTNWGLYRMVGEDKIEDSTPKFIRVAQSHGISIHMPEGM